jgi:hypothetical protein
MRPMNRRSIGAATLALALVACSGCTTAPLGTVPDSLASYNRTFDAALGAMADQKMDIGVQDRRQGNIVGTLSGDAITATLQPQFDGTIRVTFRAQTESATSAALLKRVVDAYNERMSGARLLPGLL